MGIDFAKTKLKMKIKHPDKLSSAGVEVLFKI